MKLDVQNEAFLASMKIPEAIAPVKATNELICFYSWGAIGTAGSLGTFATVGTAGSIAGATVGTFGTFGTVGTYGCH